jgi:hypothetical protein
VTNIPSACRIANIALNDAMILPYDANPDRMEFSEGTPKQTESPFVDNCEPFFNSTDPQRTSAFGLLSCPG